MAGQPDGLSRAKKVIVQVMKHKTAKAIFNEPVDVEHDFPDYLDVVKHPMDFGSILAKLEAGEASGWADCEYESPAAVLGDVELIWSNCVTYNSTDADWPTREACAEVRAIFENKWKAAGLLDAEQEPSDGAAEEVLAEQIAAEGPAAEGKVPQRFTLRPDDQELLVRLLDDFCIASAADPEDMQPLDALEDSDQQLVARGAVVAVDDTKTRSHRRREHLPVELGHILDWCFGYGDAPSIWLITEHAWYKLLSSAPEYADIHSLMLRKLDLCTAAAHALQSDPNLTASVAAERVVSSQGASTSRGGGDAEDDMAEQAAFVEAQMLALMEAQADEAAGKGQSKGRDKPPTLHVIGGARGGGTPSGQAREKGKASTPQPPQQQQQPVSGRARGKSKLGPVESGQRSPRARSGSKEQEQRPVSGSRRSGARESGSAARTAALTSGGSKGEPTSTRGVKRKAMADTEDAEEPADLPGEMGGPQELVRSQRLKLKKDHRDSPDAKRLRLGPKLGSPDGKSQRLKLKLGGAERPSSGSRRSRQQQEEASPEPDSPAVPEGSQRSQRLRLKLKQQWESVEATPELGAGEGSQRPHRTNRPSFKLRMIEDEAPKSKGIKVRLPGGRHEPSPEDGTGSERRVSRRPSRRFDAASPDLLDDEDEGDASPQALMPRKRSRLAGEDDEADDDEFVPSANAARREMGLAQRRLHYHQKRQAEAERRRKQRLAETRIRVKRERAANEARGPPPEPTRSFRASMDRVPDLIMTWELCQALGQLLQLPPFPLWRLEAALFPGPRDPTFKAEPTSAEADAVAEPSAARQEAKQQDGKPTAPATAANGRDVEAEEDAEGPNADEAAAGPAPTDTPAVESIIRTRRQRGSSNAAAAADELAGSDAAADGEADADANAEPEAGPEEAAAAGGAEDAHMPKLRISMAGSQLVSPGHTAKEGKKGKKARQHKADKEEKVARQGDAARESDAAATPAAAEDEEARKSHRLRVKLGAKLMARKAKAPAAAVSASPAKAAAAPKSAGKASAAKARPAAAAPITPAPASAEASRPAAVDPEGAASGLLLRELHCALVRAWEGKGLDASKPQPSVARLYGSDSAGVPWTERVSTAILTAPEDVVDEECREAAIRLSYAAYSDLEPSERMTILRALCNMALASEAVRDHISSRVEAMAGPRGKAKDRVEEESESAQEEGLDGNGEGAKAKPDRGAAGSSPPDAWMKWMDKFRLGMRKPLGFDYKRRKFWALGGPAGAWRIYVEEEEGRLWGWYEGQNLVDFVEWLGKGRIERETNLLKALSAVPLPRKPEGAAGTASSEAELRPVLTGKELDLRRPDGFKNQVVPQLRGEGNWDKIRLYSSVENRIFACVDALMGCVPFWLKGVSWLRQQCMVSDELAAARTPLEMGRALQQVERMLMEADVMGEEWVARWQAAWRQSVLKCGDMRESILHVASLQEHMKRAFDVLPRNAFTSIARNLQCQLYFPFPGEQVVVLRTGILLHLQNYMQQLGLREPKPEPSPEPFSPPAMPSALASPAAAPAALPSSTPPILVTLKHSHRAKLCAASADVADAQTDAGPASRPPSAELPPHKDATRDAARSEVEHAAAAGAAVEGAPAAGAALDAFMTEAGSPQLAAERAEAGEPAGDRGDAVGTEAGSPGSPPRAAIPEAPAGSPTGSPADMAAIEAMAEQPGVRTASLQLSEGAKGLAEADGKAQTDAAGAVGDAHTAPAQQGPEAEQAAEPSLSDQEPAADGTAAVLLAANATESAAGAEQTAEAATQARSASPEGARQPSSDSKDADAGPENRAASPSRWSVTPAAEADGAAHAAGDTANGPADPAAPDTVALEHDTAAEDMAIEADTCAGTAQVDAVTADSGPEEAQVAEAPTTRSVASPSLMPVGPLAEAQMRQQWEALEELVKALKPVERYKVAGIAYRRGLVDTTPEDRAAILEGVLPRWPACWLLLRPSRLGPRHQQAAAEIALPIQINNALPDFIVKMDVFDRGLQRQWRAGDTFRMFFGAKTRDRAGGVYYNGTIRNVMQQQVAATASQHEREGYDPWESLEVEWDGANENDSCERVSPWEVEVDPEEEARREEERKKQEEAAARLSRAEAKARRLAGLLAGELEGGGEDGEAGEDGARAGDADWTPAMSPGASPANSEGAAPTREYNRRPPMRVGLEGSMVPRDLLEQLRELTREQFKTLLTNWYRRVKGKFKVPIFAHQELDLHLVFFEVQDRGGYDHVTAQKLWKDVCRCLGLDLRGQTSASYNMRLNYEKCLLDFEAYLASGDYTADLAADTAPSTDSITEQERKSMVATYTPGNVGLGPSRLASASLPGSAPQLRASRDPRLAGEGGSAGYNPSTASGAWTAAELEDNMSFTDLLTGPLDGDLPMAAPRPPPTSGPGREGSAPTGKRGPGRPRKHPLPGSAAATATPGSAKGGSGGARRKAAASLQLEPAWLRMVAPVGVTTGPSQLGKGWVASTQAVPPVVAASAEPPRAPPPPLGVLLHALGAELVGRRVMRNWPDNGGWWEARVSDYRRSGCHKLTYDAGTAQESFEWVDFRELGDDEIWQHAEGPQLMAEDSLHPVPGKPNPMATIMAALKAGIAPNVLHRMVDAGAAVLDMEDFDADEGAAEGEASQAGDGRLALTAAQPSVDTGRATPGTFTALLGLDDASDADQDLAGLAPDANAPSNSGFDQVAGTAGVPPPAGRAGSRAASTHVPQNISLAGEAPGPGSATTSMPTNKRKRKPSAKAAAAGVPRGPSPQAPGRPRSAAVSGEWGGIGYPSSSEGDAAAYLGSQTALGRSAREGPRSKSSSVEPTPPSSRDTDRPAKRRRHGLDPEQHAHHEPSSNGHAQQAHHEHPDAGPSGRHPSLKIRFGSSSLQPTQTSSSGDALHASQHRQHAQSSHLPEPAQAGAPSQSGDRSDLKVKLRRVQPPAEAQPAENGQLHGSSSKALPRLTIKLPSGNLDSSRQ